MGKPAMYCLHVGPEGCCAANVTLCVNIAAHMCRVLTFWVSASSHCGAVDVTAWVTRC
jgi:hypothetical protein